MKTPTDTGAMPDSENVAGLESLAGEVAQADGLIPAADTSAGNIPGSESEPIQVVDRMAEAAMLIGIFKPMVKMAFPVIADAPDAEFDALQKPVADCLAFYNVDVSKYLSHPLAALAFSAVPLVMRGVNNWQKQQDKPLPAAAAAAAVPAGEQDNVQRSPADVLKQG